MENNALTTVLKSNTGLFAPVVPFAAATDKLLLFDFTAANTSLTDSILQDTDLFTIYVFDQLAAANAKYGIGGYAEHRTVYSRSALFNTDKNNAASASNTSAEQRRLHLGTDIWGKPYTAVMAPLDGIVHSVGNNDAFGDYGATIILTHQLEGISFYTLYGHLSLNSIKNLQAGEWIFKGDTFAEFGIAIENGQWPPHLHFQIIADMQGWKGDYPGVCKFSEKEKWLSNCPDPDLLLNLNQFIRR